MSNDPRADFQFLDFAPAKRNPGPTTIEKNGAADAGAGYVAQDVPERRRSKRQDDSNHGAYLIIALAAIFYVVLVGWFF